MEEFDWDDSNTDHVRQHGVEPEEVEDAYCDPDAVAGAAYTHRGEKRFAVIGATEDGRLLFSVFTQRSARIRPVTAREASDNDRGRYRKANR